MRIQFWEINLGITSAQCIPREIGQVPFSRVS